MLTHGIRTLFLAQSAITTLAPAQAVGRVSFPAIFTDNAVQGIKPPWIVIRALTTDPLMTLDPTYNESLKSDDIEIDCIGSTPVSARNLSETIRAFFQDYQGFVAAGNNSATATLMDATHGTLAIVGGVDGVKGVKLPSFAGSFKVANTDSTNTLNVYLPTDTLTTVAPETIATYTNVVGVYSQDSTTTTNAPTDLIKSVEWQDESYSYNYPDEGRDTKFHIATVSYKVMSA